MSRRITTALLASLLFAPTTFSQEDPVVATVNGVEINKSELDKAFYQNTLYVSDKVVTKEKVLKDLMNKILGIQKAKKAGLDKDPVVKSKMEDVLYHAQISADLEGELKKIEVTDEEVKKYYSEHPEYRTAHILFRVKAAPQKNEVLAAQEQALKVYQLLKKSPDKFGEMASRYSQSATAPNGGDMGFQPAVRMAPEYFQAIKGKPNDFITPPVRTQFGYHIIKVLAKKDFDTINMGQYKKIVYDRKRDKVLEDYFAGLRKGADIKIQTKYLKPDQPK
ncbi:MAG: hypothetical protein CME63_18420 [Halobacteriovoraceae bacterium]|nr:hypothetical protein [Halobacteriovoraceae bacterium]|tara:strand:+ start:2488 stop:3321 length:834 start_codon:yes stop_codon:yes gene_type:complete